MKYLKIDKESVVNGVGIRVVLWVSGCHHHCVGCQNPQAWDFNSGEIFNKKTEHEIFDSLCEPYIDGVTVTGGEPLSQENVKTIFNFLLETRYRFGQDKTIWLYTGYKWEEICNSAYMLFAASLCDVIVDGEYDESLRNVTLPWRGSSNQRVIDAQKSIKNKKIILWC